MRILGEVNIPLIAISSSEPTVCEIGDKYFNSSTKLIYRAVDTNIWGPNGNKPVLGILYIIRSIPDLFFYNGNTLVSLLDNFVPKTGINSDVDLGEYNIIANNLYGINTGDETKSSILSKLSFPTEGEGFLYQTEEGEFLFVDPLTDLDVSGLQPLNDTLTLLSNIDSSTAATGLLKKTGSNTWALDNTSYLTSVEITKSMVEDVLTGEITSHTHEHLLNITKEMIEGVLIGEISSHTHPYLSSITKSMVEGVLTGEISSHTHNYLSYITKSDVETVLTGVITSHQHNYLETETDPLFRQYLATVILEPSANNKVPTSKVIAEYVTDYVTTQFANYQTSNPTLASISALGDEASSFGILQKTGVDTWSFFVPSDTLHPDNTTEISSSAAIATYISSLGYMIANDTLTALSTLGNSADIGVIQKTATNTFSLMDADDISASHTHQSIWSSHESSVFSELLSIMTGIEVFAESISNNGINIYGDNINIYGGIRGGEYGEDYELPTNVIISGDLGVTGVFKVGYFDFETKVIPIVNGGTGVSSIAAWKVLLGLGNVSSLDYTYDALTKTLVLIETT